MRFVFLCVAALCLAGGASAKSEYSKYPFPEALLGTWLGSCQQHASFPSVNAPGFCTSTQVILTFPYMPSFWVTEMGGKYELMYAFNQSGVNITTNGKTYSNVEYTQGTTYAKVAPAGCASDVFCVTTYPKGLAPTAFLINVRKEGAQWVYTEQGIINTSTNTLLEYCPNVYNAKLGCRPSTFNYVCTAYKISSTAIIPMGP